MNDQERVRRVKYRMDTTIGSIAQDEELAREFQNVRTAAVRAIRSEIKRCRGKRGFNDSWISGMHDAIAVIKRQGKSNVRTKR